MLQTSGAMSRQMAWPTQRMIDDMGTFYLIGSLVKTTTIIQGMHRYLDKPVL